MNYIKILSDTSIDALLPVIKEKEEKEEDTPNPLKPPLKVKIAKFNKTLETKDYDLD
jgi:hypothetical protein